MNKNLILKYVQKKVVPINAQKAKEGLCQRVKPSINKVKEEEEDWFNN